MKIVIQLLKEFGIPLLVALFWAGYNWHERPVSDRSVSVLLNTFGPTFFFISWLFSQWYRVRKQQRVEDGLVGIEVQVKRMLLDLEEKANDLVAHITGGESVCYVVGHPLEDSNHVGYLMVIHVGKHPLYGVSVRIVDVDAFQALKGNLTPENLQQVEVSLLVGDVIPGHASMLRQGLPLGSGERRSFNVFFSARNGSFSQLLRYRKVNGKWLSAVKINSKATLFEDVQKGFPRNAAGDVEWGS